MEVHRAGLLLVTASGRPVLGIGGGVGAGGAHVTCMQRWRTTSAVGPAMPLAALTAASIEARAVPVADEDTLTPDETVLGFASTRGGDGYAHLVHATRRRRADKRLPPARLPDLDSTGAETSPRVSADGCHLYFMSTRDGSSDLFVAAMQ